MELTEAQRARIARPAKAYIEHLERQARELEKQVCELEKHIADLSAGPEGARAYIEDYVYPVRPLPDGAHVTFALGEGGPQARTTPRIQVKLKDGYVEVYASDGGALHITPQSSNVVRVRIGEW
jgi:hypothetical protein